MASAQLYSLVETAKANGQEPYAWLRHVLERLPQATSLNNFEAFSCRGTARRKFQDSHRSPHFKCGVHGALTIVEGAVGADQGG
jgi:hypothetical protein